MNWIYLNHVLSEYTPLYGGMGNVRTVRARSLAAGASSNSSELALPAHAGTHVDAPYHFDQAGATLDSYPPEFWHALRPWLLDVPCVPGEILDMVRLGAALKTVPADCDLLLVRTGAEQWRDQNPEIYARQGPGVAADVGHWLRCNRKVKFLGIDFISLSSFAHREVGREAHSAFLGTHKTGARPILPVEDMALGRLGRSPQSVWIVPLCYAGADGAPVTVLAQVKK